MNTLEYNLNRCQFIITKVTQLVKHSLLIAASETCPGKAGYITCRPWRSQVV